MALAKLTYGLAASHMGRFLLKLGVQTLLLFALSFSLLFVLVRVLGDPAQMLLGQRSDQTSLELIRAALHLDKPLWQQYLYAWADWLPYREGRWQWPTLGVSYQYGRPVAALYAERLSGTLLLAVGAMVVAVALGVSGGLWHAYRPRPWLHRIALLLLAMPSYVLGMLLIGLLAMALGAYTGLPMGGFVRQYDPVVEGFVYEWRRLVLPTLALALRPAAYLFQLTASQAQAILQADYIRAARARGKAPSAILSTDVLRNLLPALAVATTQWLAGLFTGALFVEMLFDWPGVGKLLFEALLSSDFPLILGTAQLSTLGFVLLHALSEILSRWSDPRLRP